MKKLYLAVFLTFSFSCLSQDPQLFANEWFLHKIVASGQEYFTPMDTEPGSLLFFDESDFVINNPSDGSSDWYNVTFTDMSSLDATYGGGLIGFGCSTECIQFYALHSSVYRATSPSATLNYLVSTVGGHPQLSVTNINGDQAYYSDVALSSEKFDQIAFEIYPNPVHDILNISDPGKMDIEGLKIFDLFGNNVVSADMIDLQNHTINMTAIPAGIYLMHGVMQDGRLLIKKVIKI